MYITQMRIKNYRNFKDLSMTFHPLANYLVGENDIGKSSFLRLISFVTRARNVDEIEYDDPHQPIRIDLEVQLLEGAKEHFADTPDDHRRAIRVRLEMRVSDIVPRLYDLDTGEELPLETIRRLRYVSYSALSQEDAEVRPQVYRALERRLAQWEASHCGPIPQDERCYIQHEVNVGTFDSSYYECIFYLSRILCRSNRHRADNLKFISLAALRVITQIYQMAHSLAVPLEHNIIVDKDGKRYLPLIISIDEPEIHLHPYMQRSILEYYQQLLRNEDASFCALLKDLFGLDGLRGQLFVVTHSTDSLIDDYRNIVRLYRDHQGQVKAACGSSFHVKREIEKHLIMHFPEVKEALYARSVILVEGETEFGCFQLFGQTVGVPFDYYGICLINARGESSIAKIKKLLEYFRLPVVALYDADVKEAHAKEKGVYFTQGICFEQDLAQTMLQKGKRQALDKIIDAACGTTGRTSSDMLKKACHKLQLNPQDFPPGPLYKAKAHNGAPLWVPYFAWLYSNKGVILGRLIGQSLEKQEVPPAFAKVIHEAGRLATV